MKIALADDFHLNERNFPTLYSWINSEEHTWQVLIERENPVFPLIRANGNYDMSDSRFTARYAYIKDLELSQIRNLEFNRIGLLRCVVGEALSRCLPSREWQESPIENNLETIAELMWRQNREVLLTCMTAGWYWLDYWYERRAELYTNHVIAVFSGSWIYTRTLMELLRSSRTKCFVLETLFTGHDYYFEERYSPIANSAKIKLPNIRRKAFKTWLELSKQESRRQIADALNRLLTPANKNVLQPARAPLPPSFRGQTIALVIGQVVNDYSIIEGGGFYINTIPVYRELVAGLLDKTDSFVIFKAHPWERKKDNVKQNFTAAAMEDFRASLRGEQQARLLILEDMNLWQLLEVSTWVISLCSQAAMEAAAQGFKPVLLGNAFFGRAGFTSDYAQPAQFIEELVAGKTSPLLTLAEYEAFSRFVAVLFQDHLSSTREGGEAHLAKSTASESSISIRSTIHKESDVAPRWAAVATQLPSSWDFSRLGELSAAIAISPVEKGRLRLTTNEEIQLPIEIINNSDFIFPVKTADGKSVYLSYYLKSEGGQKVVRYGKRTKIESCIGRRHRQSIALVAPERSGKYHLDFVFVCEGIAWLEIPSTFEFDVRPSGNRAKNKPPLHT